MIQNNNKQASKLIRIGSRRADCESADTVSWPLDPLTRIIVIGLPDPLIQGFIEQAAGSADIGLLSAACQILYSTITVSRLADPLTQDHSEKSDGSNRLI